MVKKSVSKPQFKPRPIISNEWDLILIPPLVLLFVLIKIGDGVKRLGSVILNLVQNLFSVIRYQLSVVRKKFIGYRITGLKLINRKLKNFYQKTENSKPITDRMLKLIQHDVKQIKPVTIYLFPHQKKLKWFLLGIIFTMIFVFIPYQVWVLLESLPAPQLLTSREIPVTSKIFDRNGNLLYEIYSDQNRTPVTLSEIPQSLKEATIAIEDKDFYYHPGFSITGILRAAKEIVFNRQTQGGSTITQQLVRSALLTPQPTMTRKIKEITLSFWAERIYSKNQILEMYFNQVPYGGTAWGVEAASQTYFGKSAAKLNLAESAYLAGLPSAPSLYSPYGIYPEQGLKRQKEVLRRMVEDKYVSGDQAEQALGEKLVFMPLKAEIKAPHFVMFVKQLLENEYGQRRVQSGGLRVTTTLDLTTQNLAQKIVSGEVDKLAPLRVSNGAALVTNPQTGEILSMVGSKNYFGSSETKVAPSESGASFDTPFEGNVNVALSLRQPGSSIKVVNYSLALEKGFTAASIIDDSPVTFLVANQPPYTPVNYDRQFHGKVTLRMALANSYNVPAVKVLAKLGVKNMVEQGRKMGVASWQDESRYGLSLTLGGGEVTMLDMARVYGTLANQGKKQDLTAILKVTDYTGKVLEEFHPGQGEEVIPNGVVFIVADILADNQARTAAFGPNSLLEIPGKTVSVKTGTTNDLRDNWAIGFTPSYVVTVWVGNNHNQPMSGIASGVTGATPIWHQIMVELLKDKNDEPFQPPSTVVRAEVCGKTEYFIQGSQNSVSCPSPPSPSPTPLP